MIYDRAQLLNDTANRLSFDINSSQCMRVLQKNDTTIKSGSYLNQLACNLNSPKNKVKVANKHSEPPIAHK